jgi:hypothetical protein
MKKKPTDWREKLRDAFGVALADTIPYASEKEAFEEAISIADEWQDRMNEIRQEDEEDADERI